MPVAEGKHLQPGSNASVPYRAEYEVVGRVIHYKATFGTTSANASLDGQFDFDPSKLGAAEAVDAFMANHIVKADFDAAP